MEALLLCLDVGMLLAVFAWVIRNAGTPGATTGLFRYKSELPGQSPAARQTARPWRPSR